MLTVISPAKSLDMTPVSVEVTDPIWQDDAMRLARTMRNLPLKGLKSLMDLSDDLARLNRDRYRDFAEMPEAGATRPAAFMFAGDTYQGLEARTLDPDALVWAQDWPAWGAWWSQFSCCLSKAHPQPCVQRLFYFCCSAAASAWQIIFYLMS